MTTIQVHEEALDSLKRMAQKTLEERDMLLAALKRLRGAYGASHSPDVRQSAWNQASEAIAKVEGNPKISG